MDSLVRWTQLQPTLKALFPRTLQQVRDNRETASILFVGVRFYLAPDIGEDGFSVWGPPHINCFPD